MMKKIITLSLAAAAFLSVLCSCGKSTQYPKSLATDATHLWVAIDSESGGSANLAINESNYCVLTVTPDRESDARTYEFTIAYDNTSGNASVIDVTTVGGVSGNIIVAEGSEKTALSAKFSQVTSGGSQLIFQGVMNYVAIKE